MKVCRFNEGDVGLVEGDFVYPIRAPLIQLREIQAWSGIAEIISVLHDNPTLARQAQEINQSNAVKISEANLIAPIDNPPAIWAAAANYESHQKEMKERVAAYDRSLMSSDELMAEIFLKPSSSIIGPNENIVLPKIAKHVDFECELCAVIGKTAKNVSFENALDFVFGYTMCWDISVRDPWGKQRNTRNIRKGFDTFCGLGPWIVTREEILDPQDVQIEVKQNNNLVMQAHTKDQINGIRNLIRFLSSVTTLRPGTLITTGTPSGVSQLAAGDTLHGIISGIGGMTLNVVSEN